MPFVVELLDDGGIEEEPLDLEVEGRRGCTSTGSHPPGACVIFASSNPSNLGIEGPVRSMSRIPTLWPCEESERASWRVTDDLPTPPLPERMRTMLEMLVSGMLEKMI